jgi:hypothetical protein
MLKNFARLESIVEGKIGHFMVENDTPIQFIKEMLFQFGAYLAQIEAQAKANAAQEASQGIVPPVPATTCDCAKCE